MGLPEQIGPYRVRARLGSGGMAEVYEGVEPLTGEVRALKVQSALASPGRQAEALREYQLLTALDHPALPRVYRAGFTDDGRAYVVMERLVGVHARDWAKAWGPPDRPARIGAVVGLLHQLAEALAALHAVNVMHGDVKPGNVLVDEAGRARLVDLAGARYLRAPEAWFPDGTYHGTRHYSSPEQAARVAVGTAADCYSLGVMAYVLLTDTNPFRASQPEEVEARHRTLVPESPDAVVSAVPESVSRLVMALLEKRPEARPTAAAAREALAAARVALEPATAATPAAVEAREEALPAELFGLERALRRARALLQRCPDAEVLVTGEVGSGRSAVLTRLAAEAADAGRRVLVLRCDLPEGQATLEATLEASLEAALGGPAEQDGPFGRAEAEVADVEGAEVVRAGASLAEVGLVVAHALDRLDPGLVRALRKVRERLAAPPALVASSSRGVGFRKLFGRAPPVVLRRLSPSQLSRHPLWGEAYVADPEALRDLLWSSGGLAARATSLLGGGWGGAARAAASGPAEPRPRLEPSRDVPAAIADALGRMSAASQAVTAALALAGAPLDVETLAEAIGLDEAEVEQALAEAAGHGATARRAPEGDWQLTCGLWAGAALAAAPSAAARQALAGHLLGALEQRPMGEAQIRLLAAVGRPDDAVHELLLWARGASPEQALPVLEALVREAAEALPSELEVHLRRVAARTLAQVWPSDRRALAWLERARARAVGPLREVVVAEQLALCRRLERPWREDSVPALAAARTPTLLAERSLGLGRAAFAAGDLAGAEEAAQSALQAARYSGDLERQAAARELAGEVAFGRGQLRAAARELARALGNLEAAGLGRGRVAAHLAEVYRAQGQLTRASAVLWRASGQGVWAQDRAAGPIDRAWLLVAHAENELELGRLHASDELLGRLDDEPARDLASLAWERARLRERLDVARGRADGQRAAPVAERRFPALEARWRAQRATALAALGRTQEAVVLVEETVAWLAQAGHLPWWTEACVARVRVLGLAGARRPLPEPVRDWLAGTPVRLLRLHYYLAVAHRDGGGAAAWDAMGELDRLLPGLAADDRAALELMPWVARMTAARAERR